MTKQQKTKLIRIIASVVLTLGYVVLEEKNIVLAYISFILGYIVISYDILWKALRGILRGRPLDENFLMAVASVGAIALGIITGEEITEGSAVMIFYQVGELFESIAVGKSRNSIKELIDIRPEYANIEHEDGTIEKVDPETLDVGSVIVIMPGERVPIDGVVTEGESAVDNSAITGESRLIGVNCGDQIYSGAINMTGMIKLETTKAFSDSTASKIIDLVENASSQKSKSEDFISKFARIYTPVVCLSALVLAIIPPLVSLAAGNSPEWMTWIYRGLTFLVISCPCALVISVPLAFFGGIGGASRAGILIKGSNYMEPLAFTKYVLFDKTGTITKGVFEVQGVHHCPIEDSMLIELAAHAECYSTHPISISLQNAYGKPLDKTRVSDVHEYSGEGITAKVDNYEIAAGNSKLMKRMGVDPIDCHGTGTIVHVTINGIYSGHILIADKIKPTSAQAVEKLKSIGIKITAILTGDSEKIARKVAQEIGVDEVYFELLPADKVEIVNRYISEKGNKECVCFAGDGINDAPVLMRSDVGIAMGAVGSDAAIEAADVVIMDDDPMKVSKSIRIAQKCMKIVYENIIVAIGIKIICLILSALGYTSMWLAIFADTGVLILAVLNSFRALFVRDE